jgi:hypothetical protein
VRWSSRRGVDCAIEAEPYNRLIEVSVCLVVPSAEEAAKEDVEEREAAKVLEGSWHSTRKVLSLEGLQAQLDHQTSETVQEEVPELACLVEDCRE